MGTPRLVAIYGWSTTGSTRVVQAALGAEVAVTGPPFVVDVLASIRGTKAGILDAATGFTY